VRFDVSRWQPDPPAGRGCRTRVVVLRPTRVVRPWVTIVRQATRTERRYAPEAEPGEPRRHRRPVRKEMRREGVRAVQRTVSYSDVAPAIGCQTPALNSEKYVLRSVARSSQQCRPTHAAVVSKVKAAAVVFALMSASLLGRERAPFLPPRARASPPAAPVCRPNRYNAQPPERLAVVVGEGGGEEAERRQGNERQERARTNNKTMNRRAPAKARRGMYSYV